jgi:hypothetical protein
MRAIKPRGSKGAGCLLPRAFDISSRGSDPPPPPPGLCRALPPRRAEPKEKPGCRRPQAPRPGMPPLPPGLASSPAMNLDSFSSTRSSLAPFFRYLRRRAQLVLRPVFFRPLDVGFLRALVAAAKQQYHARAGIGEVQAIAGTVIDLQFMDAFADVLAVACNGF